MGEKHPSILYQVLDRIYACKPEDWNSYLSLLSQLLIEGAPREKLKKLRHDITLHMFGRLKTKLHGKKIDPQKRV